MADKRRRPDEQQHNDFALNGWNFSYASAAISGLDSLLALSRRLADPYSPGEAQCRPFCVHGGVTRSLKPCACGSALVMGVPMHMPEAIFGSNHLTLTHAASGMAIRFSPEGALRSWARGSFEHGSRSVRVPDAARPAWRDNKLSAGALDVDWLFNCDDYIGDDVRLPAAAAAAAPADGGGEPREAAGRAAPEGSGWRAHSGDGIDWELLRRREPILWSCEAPLPEDCLHDQSQAASGE